MPKRKAKEVRVPVTERALIQRVNRALAKEGEVLKTLRGERWRSNLGHRYIVDLNRNAIVAHDVDLEELGRELRVLADYEYLAEDPRT